MWLFLTNRWRWPLRKFPWLNYTSGMVEKKEPTIRSPYGSGSVQWRIKQTRDGAKRFVSARLEPSYCSPGFTPDCYVDLDLATARLVLDGLNEIIEELENEPHREST